GDDVGVDQAPVGDFVEVVAYRAVVAEAGVPLDVAEAVDLRLWDGTRHVWKLDQDAQAGVGADRAALRRRERSARSQGSRGLSLALRSLDALLPARLARAGREGLARDVARHGRHHARA